ncbi:3-oxoacyl-ACP synthase III family protein [Hyalangium rubrum]|uniref:3-oxoacyl-[acyl-carrier-protein] synthase III C-terminal domain-containing protein n=1 Tax=Hyalangium rubrum TaxID=3103134 RepID=A0ABU5H017_9BACT|nr:3-oxoacyl-[acyl-carrier-protein] synthase III C-terminal domain-containing protein [Hyalangium sp. s54d21]MDY7226123.1 3-oxoacyl-[acyl-carrier-protein] synthase III C-terminal domain-containing protein [Hyalangium sp. s54d21]
MMTLEPRLSVQVLGHGRSWPGARPVSNAELLALDPEQQGRSPEALEALGRKLTARLGFSQRYLARLPSSDGARADEETSESLALAAARRALGGRSGAEVEAFIHGTTTTSRYTGSQAAAILGQLGSHAAAYELKAGCSTSLASLHLAVALLGSGYGNVLVSCAETLSKVMNPALKETWFILADGGASVWLRREDVAPDFEIQRCLYATDGRLVDLYTTPGKLPPDKATLEQCGYCMFGDGARLREEALRRYREMLQALFPDGRGLERIRWVVAHQINRKLIEQVCQESGLNARLIWSADRFGNLGGTSVLFSLSEALEQGLFAPGDSVLLMSVGGGLSFAMQHWVKR